MYPNATHTRFQHSLGVGHLAYKFAEKLRKEHPDKMDEKDSICIMLAGLCHDLGKIFFTVSIQKSNWNLRKENLDKMDEKASISVM